MGHPRRAGARRDQRTGGLEMNPDDLSWMYAPAIRPRAWHIERRRRLVRNTALWVATALVVGTIAGFMW